jgi:hypothetical protein
LCYSARTSKELAFELKNLTLRITANTGLFDTHSTGIILLNFALDLVLSKTLRTQQKNLKIEIGEVFYK